MSLVAPHPAFGLGAPYLRTDGNLEGVGGLPWFSEYGVQQTCGFRALKVWMALPHKGIEGYRVAIEHDLACGHREPARDRARHRHPAGRGQEGRRMSTTSPDLPIGPLVDEAPANPPGPVTLPGRYAILEPLDPARHADPMYRAVNRHDDAWLYLYEPPPRDRAAFDAILGAKARSHDRVYFAIVDRSRDAAAGYASYLRIEPSHRSIEVGDILFTPELQRTRAATEAMYLMARHAFEALGYRRYEWKCNALNAASMRAAERLGFTYEGTFRQHMIVKGRNRDTAWFSMLDSEWPERKAAFERWLDPANFDASGAQRAPLRALAARVVRQV